MSAIINFFDIEKNINTKPVLYLVKTDKEKRICKSIIEKYHSYVPSFKSVGRRIDWLIEYQDELVGMIGIGSSTYPPPKDLLRYLNISKEEYRKTFNSFANNWRFCLIKKIPNLGTMVLKEMRCNAGIEWKKKYNNDLHYIITFVGEGRDGAVYKADNWVRIGETSGLPKHKSVSMKWDDNKSLKNKFVKPTGENKKMIFIKKIV
ncbi:MAG TPA: DUF4338 domain-containing protein [Bacteroidales bacterium]|nr:DUF4338 domain-containing protein [Bacteroidales bacterium]